MRINNMKVFDYLIFLFGSIIIHGCNQSTKEIVFYPIKGGKTQRITIKGNDNIEEIKVIKGID